MRWPRMTIGQLQIAVFLAALSCVALGAIWSVSWSLLAVLVLPVGLYLVVAFAFGLFLDFIASFGGHRDEPAEWHHRPHDRG